MLRKGLCVSLIVALLSTVLGLSFVAQNTAMAAAYGSQDYYNKVNTFIQDNRWKEGVSYGNDQTPYTSKANAWSCYAYVTDFAHEVWGQSFNGDSRPGHLANNGIGTKFTNPAEISPGDVIYYSSSDLVYDHYYAVLERYADGSFWTAEGNAYNTSTGGWNVVQIATGKYSMSKLADDYHPNKDTTIPRYFQYGWHMPGWTMLDKSVSGQYFVVTANPGYVRSGYYDTESVVYNASPDESFRIVSSIVNTYNNRWYQVEYRSGQYGWIYSERGYVYSPTVKTITNVDSDYVAPLHVSYYGSAQVTANAVAGDTVTVIGTKTNTYGNLWYHVIYNGQYYWLWSEYCNPNANSTEMVLGAVKYYGINDPEMGTTIGSGGDGTTFNVNGASSYSIPAGATTIGSIQNAGSLKSLTIPASVTSIGTNAFSGCSSLTTIYYAGTSAGWNSISKSSTGNGPLTSATVVFQGDSNSASFTSVTAEPTTTNAMLRATVKVNSGSGTFTGSGIRVYQNGTLIASKNETHSYFRSATGTSSYNIWYDITNELGKTLTAGTRYTYNFYSVFNGTTIWSGEKSFTTTGTTGLDFTFTLEDKTETSVTFSFKANSDNNSWGIYSEFGHTITDLTTGTVYSTYSNTTDPNLGSNSGKQAQWFSINSWTPYSSLSPGHTYGMQFYFVFNGTRFNSDTYTFTMLDNTAPVISNVKITNLTATGYTISATVTDNYTVNKVQFPTWTEQNGQDDLVWHDGNQSGNTWSYTVNTNNGHNGEKDCNYISQVYAWDKNGNQSHSSTVTQYVDATSPVISEVEILSTTNSTYQFRFKATDDRGISSTSCVSFISTDYRLRTSRSKSGDYYTVTVYITSPVNSGSISSEDLILSGYFTTEVSVYDAAGNAATKSVYVFLDAVKPQISDLSVDNNRGGSFDISCLVTDDCSGVERVQFVVLAPDEEEPVDWATNPLYAGTYDGEKWIYHVDSSDHNDATGVYTVIVHAWDAFGNEADICEAQEEIIGRYEIVGYETGRDLYNGHTYVSYTYTATREDGYSRLLTWEEADEICKSMGGWLVTIDSWNENLTAARLVNGPDSDMGFPTAWIGLSNYKWITGEPFRYQNWAPVDEGTDPITGKYAMLSSNGMWYQADESNYSTFICEFSGLDLEGYTILNLPENVKSIEEEAFVGIDAQVVVVPDGCDSIGSRAFVNCPNLKYIIVGRDSGIQISAGAYDANQVKVVKR